MNFVYSFNANLAAFTMLFSFDTKWYSAKLNGPECFTNFLPNGIMSPRSLKLFSPGWIPEKLDSSCTKPSTWSFTWPNVNSIILLFNGFLSKLWGIS